VTPTDWNAIVLRELDAAGETLDPSGSTGASMPAATSPTSSRVDSPCEWIRIFAVRFAQRCPDVSAEDVVRTAISEFRCSGHLPPEHAASLH
jgi:hypothetical protein